MNARLLQSGGNMAPPSPEWCNLILDKLDEIQVSMKDMHLLIHDTRERTLILDATHKSTINGVADAADEIKWMRRGLVAGLMGLVGKIVFDFIGRK